MSSIIDRIAAAPISWGVCEVPNWGFQLGPERVLAEMAGLGIVATEFGPADFLPADAAPRAEVLNHHGLQAIGGFFPVVLHDAQKDPMPAVQAELDAYEATGADVLVLAAESGLEGYDEKVELDDAGWALFASNLNAIVAAAAARGVTVVVHPHVGTMIETPQDVARLISDTTAKVCLDTGHLLIGGSDPRDLVREHPDRIGHTHLKDVRAGLATQVQDGSVSYTDAVKAGMYVPLGAGDVGIREIVEGLEAHGYQGWYVMEQDAILESEPSDEGPLGDIRASVQFLKDVAASL